MMSLSPRTSLSMMEHRSFCIVRQFAGMGHTLYLFFSGSTCAENARRSRYECVNGQRSIVSSEDGRHKSCEMILFKCLQRRFSGRSAAQLQTPQNRNTCGSRM